MTKKSVSAYRNPLDWFLDGDPDDYNNLTVLARRFADAEPFDSNSFRHGLVEKLKRHKYQPAKRTGNEKTFHKILTDAGVLNVLLKTKTLHELWKCLLLKKIVEGDRKLEDEDKAVDEQPLRVHRKQARQIYKDLLAIEDIAERHNALDEADKLSDKLARQYRDHVVTELISTKYRGSRAALLSGRPPDELRNNPRDEDVATKVAIYRTLQWKLQTRGAKRKGIFDILLCQLAELVWAAPNVQRLSDGQALYRAVKRSS